MSFAAEFIADSSGQWCGNGVRFATRKEAEAYADHKAWSWTEVRDERVVESADPVNYRWTATGLEEVT